MDKIEKQVESSSDEDDEDEKADEVGALDIAMSSPTNDKEFLGNLMNEDFEDREISSGSPASGKKKNDYKQGEASDPGDEDKILLVDKNERRHEEVAIAQLEKDQIISLKATKSDETHRFIVTKPAELIRVSNRIQREH